MTTMCETCNGTGKWSPHNAVTIFTCSQCYGTGWRGDHLAIYAGIGSRETPEPVLNEMRLIAMLLAGRGWCLKSGRAVGADRAFEEGAKLANGRAVYRVATLHQPALDHAAQFHPNWGACDEHARALHARNSQIMLGDRFDEPVKFVVCWTEGGAIVDGTGQALRIAAAYNIPVFNLAVTPSAALWEWLQ